MNRVQVVSIQMVREKSLMVERKQVIAPEDAAKIFEAFIGPLDREAFVVGLLDTKNNINALNLVSLGSVNASIAHCREVFKAAILSNAASIMICHNHPSGNPQPSRNDLEVTKNIKESGKILGIPLLDHIILGYNSFVSFKADGLM